MRWNYYDAELVMKSRRRMLVVPILSSALLLLSSVISCTAPDSAPSSTPTGVPGPEIIRLTNGEWPPYLGEDLPHYGIVSRILTEAFALEGVGVEYGFFPWERAYELAKDGEEWDGSTYYIYTHERQKYFYGSESFGDSIHVIFHLKSYEFDWTMLEDMQGITIGATEGLYYEEDFRNAEESGNVKIEWIPQDEMIIRMLLAGRIDVFVQDMYVGYSLLKKYLTPEERQLVTHHPKPYIVTTGSLLLSRNVERNREMIVLFNRGLQRLSESGKVDEYFAELLEALREN